MKVILSYKFWLYYTAILSTLLLFGGFFVTQSSRNLIIANILFIPAVLFFWLSFWKYKKFTNPENATRKFMSKGIAGSPWGFGLLIYTALLCTVITVGGYAISRSNAEIVSNTIFLPITIFCWYVYYSRPKKSKVAVIQTGRSGEVTGNKMFNSERMRSKNWQLEELSGNEGSEN